MTNLQSLETKQQAVLANNRLDSLRGDFSSALADRRIFSPALKALRDLSTEDGCACTGMRRQEPMRLMRDTPPALGSRAVRELAAFRGICGDNAQSLRQNLHVQVVKDLAVDVLALAEVVHLRRVWTQDVIAALSYRMQGPEAALCCLVELVPSAQRKKNVSFSGFPIKHSSKPQTLNPKP